MSKLFIKLLINILLILLAAHYVPGIEVSGFYIALIVAIVLGVINLIIKPILIIFTLPINIITFGLFTFVINASLFWFVSTFIKGFNVDGFVPAFLGALVISIGTFVANKFIKSSHKDKY